MEERTTCLSRPKRRWAKAICVSLKTQTTQSHLLFDKNMSHQKDMCISNRQAWIIFAICIWDPKRRSTEVVDTWNLKHTSFEIFAFENQNAISRIHLDLKTKMWINRNHPRFTLNTDQEKQFVLLRGPNADHQSFAFNYQSKGFITWVTDLN